MQEFARADFSYGSFTYSYILQYELNSQNEQKKQSTITIRALIEVKANNITWSRGNAVLDGSSFALANTYYRGTTEVYRKQKTITHDSNGNASITVGGSINTSFVMNGSCSGTINFPKIETKAKIIKHEASEISSTSIKIVWETDRARNYTQYSLNGGAWIDAGDTVASDQKSGYFTINNLNSATKYSIKTRVRVGANMWTESKVLTITTLGVMKIGVGGNLKNAIPYLGVNGEWRKITPYIGVNGEWKRGK